MSKLICIEYHCPVIRVRVDLTIVMCLLHNVLLVLLYFRLILSAVTPEFGSY